MKIGIDIDDTIVNTFDSAIKYADKYDREYLAGQGRRQDIGSIKDSYYFQYLYNWTDEELGDFFNKYYNKILEEVLLLEDASYYINKLKEEGNQIVFITARRTDFINCDIENLTKKSLEDNNIPYDKLIFNARSKLAPCKDNEIDIFIDDSYNVCRELYENGVKVYLMNSKTNKNIDDQELNRVSSWKEIYLKIKEYEKVNQLKV